MRRRTITMIILMVICGLGIGLLASFRDGFYSAIFLFLFPVFTALMFLFISIDIAKPPQKATLREIDARIGVATRDPKSADSVIRRHRPARI